MIKLREIFICNNCSKELKDKSNFFKISVGGDGDSVQIGCVKDDGQFYIEEDKHYCDFKCFISDIKDQLGVA